MTSNYISKGWQRFAYDARTAAWAAHARVAGRAALSDPAFAEWLQCEGTWFIGVDALPNDSSGQLPEGPALAGPAIDFITSEHGALGELHRAQVSAIFPGYPRPRVGEGEAAFRYRLNRDAAHVDGIKLFGADRRRRIEEPHAWVLGLPLNAASPEAAPLVVWEGSHHIMRAAFQHLLKDVPPEQWSKVDVTETYTQARREVFDTCPRVTVHAQPGESYLMHRLCLHGVAPWAESAEAPDGEGRMIAYFRPEIAEWQHHWLSDN